MKRCNRTLSTIASQALSQRSSPHYFTSRVQCERFISPLYHQHQSPSACLAGANRRWDCSTQNIGSFRTITTSSDSNNDMRHQFREIGDRLELADRDSRKPSSAGDTPTSCKSVASLTSEFCKSYLSSPDKHPSSLENDPKQEFIQYLLDKKYGVDEEAIVSAMDSIHERSLRPVDVHRIRELCTPQYERYFHYILGAAQQDLGVAFLVKLRRDIREIIHYLKFVQQREKQEGKAGQLIQLQALERSIQAILTSLFRPGVLQLQRITYEETPAAIIEQIAFKEAVHPLQSLQDLRTRLGPGRRCFAFFHPALPDKPLVFVHVALLTYIPESMSDLEYASELDASCATFYSITNTEPAGLAGVDLGNHLIKSVVQVLQNEFPEIDNFCTLSPIPMFRKWLEGKITRLAQGSNDDDTLPTLLNQPELQQLQSIFPSSKSPLLDLLEALKSSTWHKNSLADSSSELVDQLEPVLMKLAGYYLTIETHRGRPLCPVAKFHIRNGSEMYRLNYMADTSQKGMRNSCGMMINYRYALDDIEQNRVQYEINGNVAVRDGVSSWLNTTDNS